MAAKKDDFFSRLSTSAKVVLILTGIIEFLYVVFGPVLLSINIKLIDLDIPKFLGIMMVPHTLLALINFFIIRLFCGKFAVNENKAIKDNLHFSWIITQLSALIISVYSITCGNMIVDLIIVVLVNLIPSAISYVMVRFCMPKFAITAKR